jgi:hypothetical protein
MTAADPGAVPGTETWTYGGIRADRHGKRWHAWLDAAGEEHWFSRTGGQMAVGSHYTVQVSRHGGALSIEPRFGTATLVVAVADENGGTARPGQRSYFDLHPDPGTMPVSNAG